MRVLADQYDQAVEKLISSGTVVAVDRSAINEPKGLVWYLPHFFVTNPNKPGKIRVVSRTISLDLIQQFIPQRSTFYTDSRRPTPSSSSISSSIVCRYHRLLSPRHCRKAPPVPSTIRVQKIGRIVNSFCSVLSIQN